ncbi:GNAT family N-acetyltransferase [Paucibacter sp. APW11]|uniref:GNAT family N-acetyltransferase n=1 Tax=Roseateles aquae TaxID=3077235 RepID=A0ABU3PI84_9BURK|nr:GNAT family N-acetyltransferase [Paucibacter sp. APW11]MDT9002286.1 GNAT family N-acetyltransferase [Paucibacter sp. APW11]
MLIRQASVTDIPTVAALHAASWKHSYRGVLGDLYLDQQVDASRRQHWSARLGTPAPNQRVLLLEEQGEALGFACVLLDEDAVWGSELNNLHVARSAQGRGLGRLLMQAAAKACEAAQSNGLYLWVVQANVQAQGFYARLAGREAGGDVWEAPEGSRVPMFRYAWNETQQLAAEAS